MTSLHYLPLATLLLAARVLISFAELTGENVCHKKETYTVTMRVIVKEPVQVKSYTWCLRVPPRCTKYKIEMRDKFKIQTEIRERVVDVCCAGYGLDRTETHCIPVCGPCLHGVCSTPNTCDCEPGYTGEHCDKECQKGLWGAACKQECQCENGATCNHVTGDCKCAGGWRGISCEVPCLKGTYGQGCMNECKCPTNNSGENSTCHHVTGECETAEPKSVNEELYPNHSTTVLPKLDAGTTVAPSEGETGSKAINSTYPNEVDVNSNGEGGHDSENGVFETNTVKSILVDSEQTVTSQSTSGGGSSVASTVTPLTKTERNTFINDVLPTTQIRTFPTVLPTAIEEGKQIPNLILNNSVTSTSTFQGRSPTSSESDTDVDNNAKPNDSSHDEIPEVMRTEEPGRSEGEEEEEESGITKAAITEGTNMVEIKKTTDLEDDEHTENKDGHSTIKSDEHTGEEDGPATTEQEEPEDTENKESSIANSDETELTEEEEEEEVFETTKREEETTRDTVSTEPQNIQIPPRRVIVVSDGLVEQRMGDGKTDDSKDGVWDLVSSVSVAGGVAFVLIVLAAVTLLISHRRNNAKLSISEGEPTFRRQQEQLPSVPGPQMYNYTEDVQTLPLRHLFPDVAFRPEDECPSPDGLQLRFGDVTSSAATNNNLGHPYQPYNNPRAYLELQYDIPPSSINSKTNSLQPGMEPEHLYDEIPCWRSNTTASTNTDTDTSRC